MRKLLFILIAAFTLVSCKGNAQEEKPKSKQKFEVSKSESEWKKELTDAQFKVLRKAATETPFSSKLLTVKGNGTFVCAA
ncbi:peptide-methionine (R)-S-oxide reductase, partial [Zunongwangia atlantica 22II14-10F7]